MSTNGTPEEKAEAVARHARARAALPWWRRLWGTIYSWWVLRFVLKVR